MLDGMRAAVVLDGDALLEMLACAGHTAMIAYVAGGGVPGSHPRPWSQMTADAKKGSMMCAAAALDGRSDDALTTMLQVGPKLPGMEACCRIFLSAVREVFAFHIQPETHANAQN